MIGSYYYRPALLEQALQEAADHSGIAIVAPAAYGKTRAARLLAQSASSALVLWYSGLSASTARPWDSLCDAISLADADAASRLRPLNPQDAKQWFEAITILNGLRPPGGYETWLLLDDYHLIGDRIHPALTAALLSHRDRHLHVVLIARRLQLLHTAFLETLPILWIGAEQLLLSPEDIEGYFNDYQLSLSPQDAAAIHERSLGWALPIREHLLSCLSIGRVRGEPPVDRLLAETLDSLMPRQKLGMLQCIAFFDRLSREDVQALCPSGLSGDECYDMLRSLPLVNEQFQPAALRPHASLRRFLYGRLKSPGAAINRVFFRRGARRLAETGDLPSAIGCYYEIRDYKAILSLDLKLLAFARCGNYSFEQIALDIAERCPRSLKKAYPLSMLRIAYMLCGHGQMQAFQKLMKQLSQWITPQDTPHLYGEWLIVAMMGFLPDTVKMYETLREAEKYLKGPPQAIAPEEPFLFGCPSPWYVYRHIPGQADRSIENVDRLVSAYHRIVGDRGRGTQLLYRGELAMMRCQYDLAEQYAMAAASMAHQSKEPTATFGIALLMARNGAAMGDLSRVQQAISYLELSANAFPALRGTAMLHTMLEVTRALILAVMVEHGLTDQWEPVAHRLPDDGSVLSQMCLYVRVAEYVFNSRGQEAQEALKDALIRLEDITHTSTLQLVHSVLALQYCLTGRPQQAAEYLRRALDLSYADGFIAMFVQHRDLLKPAFELLDDSPYAEYASAIMRAPEHRLSPLLPYAHDLHSYGLPASLSRREKEVAELASRGLRNQEIAQRLFISESTVKKHLQHVFAKLDIDRRSHLVKLLKQS